MARLEITSLVFIFVCVPEPVCQITWNGREAEGRGGGGEGEKIRVEGEECQERNDRREMTK